jgi:large subunit ribosomal protein L19
MNPLLKAVEDSSMKKDLPKFEIGDTVDVHLRILEGNKERVQIFQGTVIAIRGDGMREMFTVRRIVQGEGVERTFPLHSPKIAKIEVKRSGETRRAKLYYLRDRIGKATRLRERKQKETPAQIEAAAAKRARKKATKTEKTEKTDK